MKIIPQLKRRSSGFVLLLVLLLSAFSLIILAGMMNRTSTVSLLNQRNTQLSVLDNAAEAAVEKVYARMASDFMANGPGWVTNLVATGVYQSMVPNSSDNTYWGDFTFSDPSTRNAGQVYVSFLTNYNGSLPTQYTNQFAYNSPIYRIACNAANPNSAVNVTGTAMEDVLLALVPITTYAIFYNGELEFSDCATMTVNGRVHSNADICVGAGSGASLTFNSLVTCCQTVSAPTRGGISTLWTVNNPSTWATTFNGGYKTNYAKITVALTMTNTHSIIDIPPAGENVMSQQGMVRLYNQAQVILVVTNPTGATIPTVMLTLQTAANQNLPATDLNPTKDIVPGATPDYLKTNQIVQLPFLTLTNTIPDLRQNQTSQYITQIDVNGYDIWLQTNVVAKSKFNLTNGPFPTILYVADRRNLGTTKQAAVRLVNAAKLPTNKGLGFTVATQNPIYIQGNYNITTYSNTWATALGSTTNGARFPPQFLPTPLRCFRQLGPMCPRATRAVQRWPAP